jgi:hypothetical protein
MIGAWKTRAISPSPSVGSSGIKEGYEIRMHDLQCCDARHRQSFDKRSMFSGTRSIRLSFLETLARHHIKETVSRMNHTKRIDQLVSKRWPKLKKRLQNEENPGKLIAILEEIDDLLFIIETRVAGQSTVTNSRDANSISLHREFSVVPSDDSEIGSQ